MKVVCEKCKGIFSIPEEKVPEDGAKAKCKKCGNIITITRPKPVVIEEGPEVFLKPEESNEDDWYVIISGKKEGPISMVNLTEMIKRGEVDQKTLVWTSRLDNWTKAKRIEELIPIFKEQPPKTPLQITFREEKIPELALFLSGLLPGLGQIYNEQRYFGILLMLNFVSSLIIYFTTTHFTSVFAISIWLWSIIDAFIASRKINTGEMPPSLFTTKRNFFLLAVFFLVLSSFFLASKNVFFSEGPAKFHTAVYILSLFSFFLAILWLVKAIRLKKD